MKSSLPGQPELRLQAVATGLWSSRRVTAYITGAAIAILVEHHDLLQTIYDDDDDTLEAIAIDEVSGKIAACTDGLVRIYKPIGQDQDTLKWALQSSFHVARDRETALHYLPMCLSWGSSEELLVGHGALELYQTSAKLTRCWHKRLANPVRTASLSYDSAYIASVGHPDNLVKVWRRLSYDSDDVRFDLACLAHPQPVVSVQWRRPCHPEQTTENVLYTMAMDNQLRVWTASNRHGHQLPHLWGTLDLVAPKARGVHCALMMHGRDFVAATEHAIEKLRSPSQQDAAALQYLVETANRNPEICMVFDGHGRMSAWALENVGHPGQKPKISSLTNATSPSFEFLARRAPGSSPRADAVIYHSSGGGFHMLLHTFDGCIDVYKTDPIRLFYPGPGTDRLVLEYVWSGHSEPIRKMVRNFTGRAMVSRTQFGQCILWRHIMGAVKPTLQRQMLVQHIGHVDRVCLLEKGRFVIFLQHERVSVWECQSSKPALVSEADYQILGKPLCLVVLPRPDTEECNTAHLTTVTSEKQGIVWEVILPGHPTPSRQDVSHSNGHANGIVPPSIREFFRFELHDLGELAYVLPVDPAGATPTTAGLLDVFSRDVVISYTRTGRVEFWAARVDEEQRKVEWLPTSSMETGVHAPALVSGSTLKTAALVDTGRSCLTIWDIRGARLEYAQEFEIHQTIQDLDWTSTPDSQSILAVGFPHRVLLMSQMRFDYLNKGPAWAAVREISIRDMSLHPIGDSTWLGDGHLAIGAGNQLYVYDRQFDVSDTVLPGFQPLQKTGNGTCDLFKVVQRLNGPLPVFHPQFLSQCLLAGKMTLVHRILVSLHHCLKFWIEDEDLDDYLGIDVEDIYASCSSSGRNGRVEHFLASRASYDDGDETFTEEVAVALDDKLKQVTLPRLSAHEQIQLLDMVDCVGFVEKHRRSMDENGARFMLFFRQHALSKQRTSEMHVSWREISWAYHSDSHDILVDFVFRQQPGAFLWEQARESGMFMWLTDAAAVRTQFEVIARNEYTKGEQKNPVDCSLFYLALRKKTVLQGLWRMASWNREQQATQRLLANNFDDAKWKTAALKNAYALMSKRRFAYAAAFFLLADRLQDAVNVCLNQLEDVQLAVAVARVHGGDQSPILQKLLEEEVLAMAAREGNRWLASWAFWMLQRRDMAVRALITPIFNMVQTGVSAGPQSKLFLSDDPALVVLYAQLRQTSQQTFGGASKVTPRVEWAFVMHNARLYDRMGCDLLGLDLVRNWKFLQSTRDMAQGLGGDIDPTRPVGGRGSLVVADLAVAANGGALREIKSGRGDGSPVPTQPTITVFEEPDADSLLANFGF